MFNSRLRRATALATLVLASACSDDPVQQEIDTDLGPSGGSDGLGPTGGTPSPGTPNDGPGNPPVTPGSNPGPGNNPSAPGSNPGPGGSTPPSTPGSNPGPGGSDVPPGDVPGSGGSGPSPMNPGPGAGGNGDPGPGPSNGGSTPVGNGGNTPAGGTPGAGGMGPDLDQNGKANARPGDTTSAPQDYLRLGEIRILNNNWGSEDLNCNTPMSVFVNEDRSFGWTFSRGDCDTGNSNQKPDFPQVEFGIHPFGIGNHLVTSPEFSSTTLLPLQIKDIQSASVSVQNLTIDLQREGSWNITFEFWLSERDPVNDPNPGVYAELMTFWGWQGGRWPSAPGADGAQDGGSGTGAQVSTGGKGYTLWVQRDQWADGWRYFQFRADDGPQRSFNGSIDVKVLLDYLVNQRQYSPDYWVTRLEVGSEIDDETQGTVQMSGITFEVNGESRSPVFGE